MKKSELTTETTADSKHVLNAVAVKLSKVQKELIKQMQDGIICHYMQGFNARCFLARTHKNISWATIYKLEQLGLIERTDKQVVLTEKGRSYCY